MWSSCDEGMLDNENDAAMSRLLLARPSPHRSHIAYHMTVTRRYDTLHFNTSRNEQMSSKLLSSLALEARNSELALRRPGLVGHGID